MKLIITYFSIFIGFGFAFLCTKQPRITKISGVTKGFFSADINAKTGEYYPGQRCGWNITVRPNARIRFLFGMLELVPSYFYRTLNESLLPYYDEACGCDRVTIYEQSAFGVDKASILEQFCGDSGKPASSFLTRTNIALVYFCTDLRQRTSRKYRGFTIYFDEVLSSRNATTRAPFINMAANESSSQAKSNVQSWESVVERIAGPLEAPTMAQTKTTPVADTPKAQASLHCFSIYDTTVVIFGVGMGVLAIAAIAFLIGAWIKEERSWASVAKAMRQGDSTL